MTLGGKRRDWRMRVAARGVVVVGALVLAGCGGGGSSSSSSSRAASGTRSPSAKRAAAYRSDANALCDAMRDRLRHLGPAPRAAAGSTPRRLSSAGRYFRGREADVSHTIVQLSALRPPAGERPAIRRLMRSMRRTDVLEQNQYRSALRGFRPGFLRASLALRPALSAERRAARSAHLRACGLGQPR
jgi:hypothetical protein